MNSHSPWIHIFHWASPRTCLDRALDTPDGPQKQCKTPRTFAGGGSETLPQLSRPGELNTVPRRPATLAYSDHTNTIHDAAPPEMPRIRPQNSPCALKWARHQPIRAQTTGLHPCGPALPTRTTPTPALGL